MSDRPQHGRLRRVADGAGLALVGALSGAGSVDARANAADAAPDFSRRIRKAADDGAARLEGAR